jgi:predicted TIM-barrel fold metal-dependent hydrolase
MSLEYPEAKFIMGHSGSRYSIARQYVELAKKRDNIFLEITYTSITYGMIKYLVNEVGDEKVLYGSDSAFRDIAPQLGWVAYAKISEESKRKILGLNMKRILDDVKMP